MDNQKHIIQAQNLVQAHETHIPQFQNVQFMNQQVQQQQIIFQQMQENFKKMTRMQAECGMAQNPFYNMNYQQLNGLNQAWVPIQEQIKNQKQNDLKIVYYPVMVINHRSPFTMNSFQTLPPPNSYSTLTKIQEIDFEQPRQMNIPQIPLNSTNYVINNSNNNNIIKPSLNIIEKQSKHNSILSLNQNKQPIIKKICKPYQDTKNVPKNYTKALFKHIKSMKNEIIKLLRIPDDYPQFLKFIDSKKEQVLSIKLFKKLFISEQGDSEQYQEFTKIVRTLFYRFIKQSLISYLYSNKKFKRQSVMLKYKGIIIRALQDPTSFNSWHLQSTEIDKKIVKIQEDQD